MWRFVLFLVMDAVVKSDTEDYYIDPVIDMLLNGVSAEMNESDEAISEGEPEYSDGIWKCGNCTDLHTAEIVHSEVNQVDADLDAFDNVDVQISLSVDSMRCVTVAAAHSGAVRKVVGSCSGASVTLSVSPSDNFTILVYK